MTQVRHARRPDPLHLLRASLTALTALGIVGTAFVLATLKHWNGAMQLVPWAALVVLAGALAVHAGRPRCTYLVRTLAMLVLVTSLFGVLEHALVNYDSGPLDQRFADTWEMLSPWLRWWYAITRTVGPAPTLAPGMLGQAAATLLLATIGARAASTEVPAKRHRRNPDPGRFAGLTYVRSETLVAAAAAGAARRVNEFAPNRHRRPRW
ncbi:MAG: hypothetical protein JO287_02825 [Pseudonocardiales bacterium]|nr:hypothetical protein [Pseudonocardiales bacterium]